MKIGFGKSIITAPAGFSLVGYFVDRRSIGIMDNLYSTSILFDDGENICCFSVCDLIWVDKKLVKKVREIVNKKIGIKKENIFIHATHTHTGPLSNIPDNSIYQKNFYVEKSYLGILPFYIAGSIIEAYHKRKKAKIGVGIEKVEGISFNRRYYLKDGRVVTNPFNQIENILKSEKKEKKVEDKNKAEDKNNLLNSIFKEIGNLIGKMHNQNIIHGDLTTSNMIVNSNEKKIYFIDFGLSFFSEKIEDKAVDLHLLKRALESKHLKKY